MQPMDTCHGQRPQHGATIIEAARAEPWRSMEAEDALAYLVAEDVARRTEEGRDEAYGRRLGGIGNRRRLVAWRRENGLCPKCGRAIPADEAEFKHCPRCRESFRLTQRYINANLNEHQRLARNERGRRSYHKLVHGKAPPPKVVRRGAMVTPPARVGPKRDRAEYMREYRANRN